MRVFIDESGFTGEDLANQDQPVFVLASTLADDTICTEWYRKAFAGVQAKELKHSSLAKTENGRRRILEFLRAIRASNKFTVWVVHKEFCLLSKLVDLWLESALYESGIDFYDRGANLGFCNMAWFCLRTFESEAFLTRHLARFQQMVRTRTQESYDAFWGGLYKASRSCKKETKKILSYFLLSDYKLGYDRLKDLPERTLDICQTSALQTLGHWRGQTTEEIQVVHDNSSNMAREKWIWDVITSSHFPSFRVGPADFLVEYPLRVTDTVFSDSAAHLQLQFADLVAGAAAAWARSRTTPAPRSTYVKSLENAGIGEHLIGGIWPSPHVEPVEKAPDTIGANEYIKIVAQAIIKARKDRKE
jgi:hypothetical protein